MLKHLPKILISSVALFGMLTNLYLINTLSSHTAYTGVEDFHPLRMWERGRDVTQYTTVGGFISFSLIGAVVAAYASQKKGLSLRMTLLAMASAFFISGAVLGNIQNKIVTSIGIMLLENYPETAKRAISTYYVQRMIWRDNEFKNTLIPTYAGSNINTTESELFRVNMFYLIDDPLTVVGDKARNKQLMNLYYFDAVDAQRQREPWRVSDNFTFDDFTKNFQTPQHDVQRVYNTAVIPIVMASTILSLILSILIFAAQMLGLGGGHWVKVRLIGVLGVAILLLTTPVFIRADYHSVQGAQEQLCSQAFCNAKKYAVDWLFRFELGIVRLISVVV
ncbi:MAG: hypothetical protein WCC29_14040 [Pseudomonas farsensis]|uniref:hypothetical protein n=1 Tax=Pseudomonas farsensis TaxID=2745492 RepID=UPI003C7B5BE7